MTGAGCRKLAARQFVNWKMSKLPTAGEVEAKRSPEYRSCARYDKLYREDTLAFAHPCGKANRGAAGGDGCHRIIAQTCHLGATPLTLGLGFPLLPSRTFDHPHDLAVFWGFAAN